MNTDTNKTKTYTDPDTGIVYDANGNALGVPKFQSTFAAPQPAPAPNADNGLREWVNPDTGERVITDITQHSYGERVFGGLVFVYVVGAALAALTFALFAATL